MNGISTSNWYAIMFLGFFCILSIYIYVSIIAVVTRLFCTTFVVFLNTLLIASFVKLNEIYLYNLISYIYVRDVINNVISDARVTINYSTVNTSN